MPKCDITEPSPSEALRRDKPIREIGILLIPDFALISYACATEPFRAANQLSGKDLFRWRHISPDGGPVRASNGVSIVPDHKVGERLPLDLLIICAGGNPTLFDDEATFAWLRQVGRTGAQVAGISGGPFIMARAGLLDGYRCTIHWEHAPALAEAFPQLEITNALYEIDRTRLSCSGGTAALDMLHHLILRDHGRELAGHVVEWFIHTNLRPAESSQRMPMRERFAVRHPKLVRVLETMETTLEDPLSSAELAEIVHLSQRQLERLFRLHLKRSIGEHYRELRLRRAQNMLAQSSLSVLEVAVSCGFVSASHFSRAFRARFGYPPSTELSRRVEGRPEVLG